MRFSLEPTVRQLALVLPFLFFSLPAAISADEDNPGLVLPPPSLYDLIPPDRLASPARSGAKTPTSPPSISTPAASTPSSPTSPASTPTPSGGVPVQSPPATTATKTLDPVKPAPASVASKPLRAGTSSPVGQSQYAFDVPRCTIRTGAQGNCVKMGLWSPRAAPLGRDSSAVALKPVQAKTTATVATTEPANPVPLGSAPAPMPVREVRPEPVEVVALPPTPIAAREARPAQPESREETLTALAVTRLTPEPNFDELTLSAGAIFPLSSSSIKRSGHEKLDEFVEHLKGMQFGTVRIVGHTDPTGPKAMNERLSKQRAEAVKNYFVSKGIDPKRIKTAGKGGSEPLPKTRDCDTLPRPDKIICYAPDRRVEIDVLSGKPNG